MNDKASWTLKYFPERFRARHQNAYRLAAQQLTGSAHLMPTREMMDRLQRQQVEEYSAILAKMPVSLRPSRPTPVIGNVMAPAMHVGKFHVCGRQIYDISPRMLKVLASADYAEVPASMLVLPFPSIYLHFGSQEFTIKGAPFEGALVSLEQGIFEVMLVTTPTAGWQQGNMVTHPILYLYLPLDLRDVDVDTPLGEVVKAAVAKERKDLSEAARLPETTENIDGVTLIDRRASGSKQDLENFEIGIGSLDAAMNLVVNTIIYITSYREHVSTRWSENTPENIARVADGAGRPKQVVQAKAKIIEGGYYRTHFVGERSEHGEDENTFRTGNGVVAPHWRRAHWRMQVCGVGRLDRKLLLVPRVLVNANQLAEDAVLPGRVSRI
jgi:hypothetical protein